VENDTHQPATNKKPLLKKFTPALGPDSYEDFAPMEHRSGSSKCPSHFNGG
jgi:hypothetical protein